MSEYPTVNVNTTNQYLFAIPYYTFQLCVSNTSSMDPNFLKVPHNIYCSVTSHRMRSVNILQSFCKMRDMTIRPRWPFDWGECSTADIHHRRNKIRCWPRIQFWLKKKSISDKFSAYVFADIFFNQFSWRQIRIIYKYYQYSICQNGTCKYHR
jgi:hypothetical protein